MNHSQSAPEYIFDPGEKPVLPCVDVPIVVASASTLEGFGYLVDSPEKCQVEIVQWPAQGWRKVDPGTGDEGGVAEGVFIGEWQGNILMGSNEAVNGHYVLGWSGSPEKISEQNTTRPRDHIHLWHFNYHPDGGQLFFPLENKPFVVPLALPGDDLSPENVVAFWCDGSQGLYIHPNVWHEGIFPTSDKQRFLDRQGKVHARVSCDFAGEFGVYLKVPLQLP